MATMRAAVFEAAGKTEEVLELRTVPVPTPGPGEVLIKVEARPIQPADFMFIGGRYRIKPRYPQTAGLEGLGTVIASGAGSSIGSPSRVVFRYPGSWAEYATVPADRCYVVPEGVSAEQAAQFALNPVTAWALLDELHLHAGEWIAINAATSAVALLVADLARRRNVNVVGIVRPGREAPFPVVPADAADLAGSVLAITGGTPLAGYLDSVGGMMIKNILPALKPGGTLVSYGVLEQAPAPILNSDMIYRNLCWKGFGIDHWLATSGARHAEMVDELWAAIRERQLTLPVRTRYPLADVVAAAAEAALTGRSGKVLIADA